MDLQIVVKGVEDQAPLRAMAQSKFEKALNRYETHVRTAVVRIEDETGPNQHRVDKVCVVELQLRASEVRIREVGRDFDDVIAVAIDRMRAALSRRISREKRGIGEG